jgi:hypothetical protein
MEGMKRLKFGVEKNEQKSQTRNNEFRAHPLPGGAKLRE